MPLNKLRGPCRGRRDSRAAEKPQVGVDVVPPDQWALYPTSVEWQPPFTMMVPLKGAGDRQAGDDVAATVTAWGTWQPGLAPHRSPSVSEVLIAALGGARADQQVRHSFRVLRFNASKRYYALQARLHSLGLTMNAVL